MAKSFNRTRPLTKVQKEVMARFERGYRLITLPTRGANGWATFWVKEYNEGWCVEEKALYPQLRRLYWYGEIDDNNPEQVLPSDTQIVGGTWILEAAGVIGY